MCRCPTASSRAHCSRHSKGCQDSTAIERVARFRSGWPEIVSCVEIVTLTSPISSTTFKGCSRRKCVVRQLNVALFNLCVLGFLSTIWASRQHAHRPHVGASIHPLSTLHPLHMQEGRQNGNSGTGLNFLSTILVRRIQDQHSMGSFVFITTLPTSMMKVPSTQHKEQEPPHSPRSLNHCTSGPCSPCFNL